MYRSARPLIGPLPSPAPRGWPRVALTQSLFGEIPPLPGPLSACTTVRLILMFPRINAPRPRSRQAALITRWFSSSVIEVSSVFRLADANEGHAPAAIRAPKKLVRGLHQARTGSPLDNFSTTVHEELLGTSTDHFYRDNRWIPSCAAQKLRLEDLHALVVVPPAAAFEVGEGVPFLGVARAALVVDLVEEAGLGVFVEVVAVGEDVAHDREPVLAGGFRGGGVGRGWCDRGWDGRGGGCLAGGVAALEEDDGQAGHEQDRDGDAGREAGPAHGTSPLMGPPSGPRPLGRGWSGVAGRAGGRAGG